MRRSIIALLLVLAGGSSGLSAEPSIEQELHALEPVIGGYPPAIKSAAERAAVVKRYTKLKSRLDAAVTAHADDLTVRFQRATLEDMGHNIDLDGAFEQARADYTYLIDHHPGDIPALLGLATLLVNTNPTYAKGAQTLFVTAQCANGREPLEPAQRGLFFAHYYQGQMSEAKERARYLVKHWPNN
jgi:hypothetical protein